MSSKICLKYIYKTAAGIAFSPDEKNRKTWVLAKDSKVPPINAFNTVPVLCCVIQAIHDEQKARFWYD